MILQIIKETQRKSGKWLKEDAPVGAHCNQEEAGGKLIDSRHDIISVSGIVYFISRYYLYL